MIGVGLVISDQDLQKVLKRVEDAFDTTSLLDEATALLLNRIRTRFLEEKDPEGNPWVPSKSGLRRRAAGGSGTLFDTGRLFRSIQLAGSGPGERSIVTDVDYGPKHQLGLGVQKRVFLGFSEEDARVVERLLEVRTRRLEL